MTLEEGIGDTSMEIESGLDERWISMSIMLWKREKLGTEMIQ